MRRTSRAVIAAAIIGAVIAPVGSPVQAANRPDKEVGVTATGYFVVLANGAVYRRQGNDYWWGYWANKNDSMHNDGYVGGRDKVNVYWGTDFTGAYACMRPGDSWYARSTPGSYQTFFWTRNGDRRGLDESVWWNAASHRWVTYCGNNSW
jgi:hypothetical protein